MFIDFKFLWPFLEIISFIDNHDTSYPRKLKRKKVPQESLRKIKDALQSIII